MSDSAAAAGRGLPDAVLRDELRYVRDRRASQGLPSAEEAGDPSAGELPGDLVGLALSGGGIRSATFGLGLLQAFAGRGFLRRIDYLSTVSGGGFIGSSLTALLSQTGRERGSRPIDPAEGGAAGPGPGAAAFPFSHTSAGDESETLKYLRGHSDYLAPQGLIDYLRAFALLSRGIALNLALLLPILLIVSLLGMVFSIDELNAAGRRDGWIAALEKRLSSRLGPAPDEETSLAPALAILTASDLPYGFDRDEAIAALAEEPSLVRRQLPDPDPSRFTRAASWQRVANRLARLDQAQARSATLGGWEFRYGHGPGLTVRYRRDGSTSDWFPFWTDGSPIAAVADENAIVLAGHDGSLWRFYPQISQLGNDLQLALERESGLARSAGGAPGEIAPGPTGSWLIARASTSRAASGGGENGPEPASGGWDPSVLRLPWTGRTLLWLALLFVGLYPFSVILGTPLQRLAALLGRARRRAASLLRRESGSPREAPGGLAVAWRIAASVLLALPLFGGTIHEFEQRPLVDQQYLWPFLGFFWMALWWLLSLVFLAPVLRRWRPPPGTPSGSRAAPRARPILGPLLLLAPWGALALIASGLGLEGGLAAFFARETATAQEAIPIWVTHPWVVVPVWWLAACACLLRPVFLPGGPPADMSIERWREWHRRASARVYIAANLLLWVYLAVSVLHEVPREVVEYMIREAIAGFGLDEGGLPSRLTTLTFIGYLAGVQLVLWKAFARLARGGAGRDGARPAAAGSPTEGANAIAWRERYEKAFSYALVALAAVAFFELQPYLVYHYHQLKERYSVEWLYLLAAASFLAIVLAAMFLQAVRGLGRRLLLLALGILGPLLPFLVYLWFVDALVYGERWFELRWMLFGSGDPWIMGIRASFLVVTAAVAAYLLGKLVDANSTGMHGFYRDRLSGAYLVGVDEDGIPGPEGELSLPDICPEGSGAPYHLLNASLNLQKESAGASRWRNSDFFFFSRLWCGGPASGYCRTEHLEHLAPNVHLGSAMAVSAAAAAPNMGAYTSGPLVMLMALLNVRLGLWLPTPRRVARMAQLGILRAADGPLGRLRRGWQRLINRPSGYHLVHEMMSDVDAGGRYVNLSDGGHLENTGAYELLRRRCRLVVISDAESDPAVRFGSLAALMRYATIDLGIEIEIDLAPLRGRGDGTSEGHYAAGTIRYPALADGTPAGEGRLVYVKASVVGDESEIIREYRSRHPDFPHESTTDQVFEEDQFEAYRALGFHIGSGLFGAAGPLDPHGPLADDLESGYRSGEAARGSG